MTKKPTSYYLPSGKLLFPYNTYNNILPPWVIGIRDKRGEGCNVSTFNIGKKSRFTNEEDAIRALRAYAEKHELTPAY